MARPKNTHPTVNLNERNGSFRLRWFVNGIRYQVTLGAVPPPEAKAIARLANAAIAGRTDWPEEIADDPAVRRYLLSLSETVPQSVEESPASLKDGYLAHLRAGTSSTWPDNVRSHLTAYFNFIGDLSNMTAHKTHAFLDKVAMEKSKATRNRALAALSGMFRWMKRTGLRPRAWLPPTEGAQILREERPADGIVVLDEPKIPAVLKAADSRADGIAVWIAIYAGMRRGEIARLLWDDITPTCITVNISKTGRKRQIPIADRLAKRLAQQKQNHPSACPRVVPWPAALNGWVAAERDLLKIHVKKHLPKVAVQRLHWNVFRHTFASRHAQNGIPIDLIAAWLGDSPKVCREHYTRFVPINHKDIRIDLVDIPTHSKHSFL